jgi:DUF1680 family protein
MYHLSVAALLCAVAIIFCATGMGRAAPKSARIAEAYACPPVLEEPRAPQFTFRDRIGERVKANQDNWLIPAPAANPAMIEMFVDRDRLPHRDLLPWSGEFFGKYLTAGSLNLRITQARQLKSTLASLVDAFTRTQSPAGYSGPFPKEQRLQVGWDVWGHYHAIVGLVTYLETTGDAKALAAARRAADYVCETFPQDGKRVVSVGSEEMNEAIIHGMLVLYERTGEQRYLDMARRVEQDWETPPSGDYVRTALAGAPFWQTPKPRWESLHDLQAIPEMYFITGDTKYRQAFEHIWWSIVEGDRHNTGGFSSGEQACGNPYNPAAIETCCTVAWIALSLDMLRMTGESVVADEIELSTLNGGIGGQSPSGRWWTYNTPMEGERKASAHDINFQCRPGSPELNCCSVNGPRILGMLSQWSLMQAKDGLALNYYGPCDLSAELPSGERATIHQQTMYPRRGDIKLTVGVERPTRFTLRLRIPYWSAKTSVKVNGEAVAAEPGTYLAVDRTWNKGDIIEIALDMSLHFWVGEREFEGRTSVFRGPILLAYDARYNETPFEQAPGLRPETATLKGVTGMRWPRPWVFVRMTGTDGKPHFLCDFAYAGATGTPYHTWLKVEGVKPTPFSRQNPLRSGRG